MFGINPTEFFVLAVVALVVLGPDKLPRYTADAARLLRQVRLMAVNAQQEVRRELGPEFNDISLADLNPKTFVSKHLLDDDLDLDLGLDDRRPPKPRSSGPRPGPGATAVPAASPVPDPAPEPTPWDPDTT